MSQTGGVSAYYRTIDRQSQITKVFEADESIPVMV